MADLKIKLPEVDLGKVDTVITVQGTKGRLGEIHLSKGTIEWWPAGNSVNGKSLNWTEFAKVFELNGNAIKAKKKAAPAKAKAAPAAKAKVPAAKAVKPAKPKK